MKKTHLLLLILAVFGLTLVSCNETVFEPDIDIEIDHDRVLEWTAEELADEAFGEDGSNMDENTAKLRSQFLENVGKLEDSLNEKHGTNGIYMGYIGYTYYFQGETQSGEKVTLSARIIWGRYWLAGWHNLDPDDLYVLEHQFVTNNSECPTEDGALEIANLSGDCILIMPDGLGYGISKAMLHPYQNYELSAKNSLAALKAGYEVWKKYGSGTMEDDWKTYIVGLSDGAGQALALHKYLDTHEDEASRWHFENSFTSAGTYDPALTWETYYKWGKTEHIAVIPMTIKSMLASYPDILKGWTESDFYCDKYLKVKDKIDNLLEEKETSPKDLDNKINELLGTQNPTLSDVLSDEILNTGSKMYKAFIGCLDRNDLTTGWTPKHQIKVLAAEDDEFIPFANAEALSRAFGTKVSVVKIAKCGHDNICDAWYLTLSTKNW